MKHWRWAKDSQDLVWLTFDKAGESANTFSREALAELSTALDEVSAAKPKGMIVCSAKDGFVAGADVEEFTRFKTADEAMSFVKLGWDVFEKLSRLPFPTTALVNGFCMGGGVELALACRYRVALDDPKTRFSLPEVMLGILPGWHGVQWLPKRVGPTAALDMLLTGRAIDARRAKRIGLVDESVPERILENTARMVTLEARAPRALPFLQRMMLGPLRGFVASQARKQVAKRARPEQYPAPYAILELWKRYDGDPFAVAPGAPGSVQSLFEHPSTPNFIRIFFLQERLKGLGKADFEARHVHIVGAGVMGGDIATICALRGMTVTLQDTAPEKIAPAIKRAAEFYRRRLRDPRRERDALDRLIPDVSGRGAARADVIIEAIFENLDAKRSLFAKLEAIANPDAILASNTSSLRLSDIATALKNPARLIGIHFFNPVPQMQLVEVVSGAGTEPFLIERASAFVRSIDKLPLPVKDSPGFLVNRVLGPYLQNAFRLLDEGATPETLDAAMESFGMPMGPIDLADTVGLDICLHAGKALAKHTDGREADVPESLAKKVALGHLGRKTGHGIYRYVDGKAQKGAPGVFDASYVDALIEPYLAETRAVLAEGIVADADLIDAGLIFGTGFAPFRGGPLNYLGSKKG